MRSFLASSLVALAMATPLGAQSGRPVFDPHVHMFWPGEDAEALLDSLRAAGVVKALAILHDWTLVDSVGFDATLLIPAIGFPCPSGHAPNGGAPCFREGLDFPPLDALRRAIEAGKVQAFAELYTPYYGISPASDEMEPYWALAQEYDLPVGLHMAMVPPGAAQGCCPDARAALGDPLLLEDVLVRFPRVRVFLMHAGYPYLESTIALATVYPEVHLELGALQWAVPRPVYYAYLRRLVEAGFGDRLMVGSDTDIAGAVQAIEDADFLTPEQKDAILYDNAMRFFRLDGAPEAAEGPQ